MISDFLSLPVSEHAAEMLMTAASVASCGGTAFRSVKDSENPQILREVNLILISVVGCWTSDVLHLL